MDKQLKERIKDLPALRSVGADPCGAGRYRARPACLLEKMSPFTEVPQAVFVGKAYDEMDGKAVELDFEKRKSDPVVLSDTTFRNGQ